MMRLAKTDRRHKPNTDYLARMNPAHKSDLGTRYVAITRRVERLDRDLHVLARADYDAEVPADTVQLDQTLRAALGVDFLQDLQDVTVEMAPVRLPRRERLRDALNRVLGRRIMMHRACVAFVPDIELGLIRIPHDTFALLGCEEGDKLRCQAIVRTDQGFQLMGHSVTAYGVAESQVEQRKSMESPDPEARYADASQLLALDPDIPRVFVDRDFNQRVGTLPMAPVRIQRDALHTLRRELRDFGLLFFISGLALSEAIPGAQTWSKLAATGAVALAVTLAFSVTSIRARVK